MRKYLVTAETANAMNIYKVIDFLIRKRRQNNIKWGDYDGIIRVINYWSITLKAVPEPACWQKELTWTWSLLRQIRQAVNKGQRAKKDKMCLNNAEHS